MSKKIFTVIDRHSLSPKQTGSNTAFTLSNVRHRGIQDIKNRIQNYTSINWKKPERCVCGIKSTGLKTKLQ